MGFKAVPGLVPMPNGVIGGVDALTVDGACFMNIPHRAVPVVDETGWLYKNLASTGALPTSVGGASLTMGGAFSRLVNLASNSATGGASGVAPVLGTVFSPCPIRAVPFSFATPVTDVANGSLSAGRGSGGGCPVDMDLNTLLAEGCLVARDRGSSARPHGGRGKAVCEDSATKKCPVEKRRSLNEIMRSTSDPEIIVYQGRKTNGLFVLSDKKRITNFVPGFCPLSANFEFDLPSIGDATKLYHEMVLCTEGEAKKLWVVHIEPTLLKMTGWEIVDSFEHNGKLIGKGFEAVRRMMKGIERTWYEADDHSRFRCCMPTNWAKEVLAGGGFVLNQEIKDMFTGPSIDYDIETCHMIWVPVEEPARGLSVLYGFDMNLDIVHVMDPKRTCAGREILQGVHSGVCNMLLDGLISCAEAFFENWEMKKGSWSFLYHEYQNSPCSDEDTFLYSIHNIMFFDGISVTQKMGSLDDLRTQLMVMVVNMPDNLVGPPFVLKKTNCPAPGGVNQRVG